MKIIIQMSKDFIKINSQAYLGPCHTCMELLGGAMANSRQLFSRRASSSMSGRVVNTILELHDVFKTKSVYYEKNTKNLERH